MTEGLSKAISLRTEGKGDEALGLLRTILWNSPENPHVNYQMACTLDSLGKEREAIAYYEIAIERGLDGEGLRGALLGLGSSYRAIGEYEMSKQALQRGREAFDAAREFDVFLAMALYNTNQCAEAMSLLLRVVAETSDDPGVASYRRAILFYSDRLDQVWI